MISMRWLGVPTAVAACLLLATGADAAGSCQVTSRMTNNPGQVAVLTWSINYQGAAGVFKGEAQFVECEELAPGNPIASFQDIDATKILTTNLNSIPGSFTGPTDVARCTFEPTGAAPRVSDFSVLAPVTGVTPTGMLLFPTVVVSDVTCEGIVTTTTSSSTTSTTTTSSTTTSTSSTTTSSTTTSTLPGPSCGDPNGGGITSSDALFILLASVGLEICDDCICDVNGSGDIFSSDALDVLRLAVDIDVLLTCPPCM